MNGIDIDPPDAIGLADPFSEERLDSGIRRKALCDAFALEFERHEFIEGRQRASLSLLKPSEYGPPSVVGQIFHLGDIYRAFYYECDERVMADWLTEWEAANWLIGFAAEERLRKRLGSGLKFTLDVEYETENRTVIYELVADRIKVIYRDLSDGGATVETAPAQGESEVVTFRSPSSALLFASNKLAVILAGRFAAEVKQDQFDLEQMARTSEALAALEEI